MPRCSFCGYENPAGTDRCGGCGAALMTIDQSRGEENAYAAPQVEGGNDSGGAADAFEAQLEKLLRGGNKIAAIKLYRERTGAGLKDAKDAVEAFARQRNIELKQIGCGMGALLLIAAVLGIALAIM